MSRQKILVIGHPVKHSLSPIIHQSGWKALGVEDKFSFEMRDVRPEDLEDFVKEFRNKSYRGSSVTLPHKETIGQYLDEVNRTAKDIGAVNTVVGKDNKLVGYNVDWVGVVEPLSKVTDLKGKTAVVFGAGGAAKAFVYGLVKSGCKVTVVNRTDSKAKAVAKQFNCMYRPFEDLEFVKKADIVCNATSVGLGADESLINNEYFNENQIVFDANYSPVKTKFLRDAEAKGALTISGIEMLLHQGYAQFKLYTGYEAPEEAMRKAVLENLDEE